jgi:hypothetical protein
MLGWWWTFFPLVGLFVVTAGVSAELEGKRKGTAS